MEQPRQHIEYKPDGYGITQDNARYQRSPVGTVPVPQTAECLRLVALDDDGPKER